MANFKQKLKQIFSNKLVKAIGIIFMCIVGFALLGRCNKVEAINFTLSDGTTSEITYGERQKYVSTTENETAYIEFDSWKAFTYIVYSESVTIYNSNYYYTCSYTAPSLVCSKVVTSNMMGGTTGNNSSAVTIYQDYFTFKGKTFTKLVSLSQDDINNARQEGYNEGYTDGETAGNQTGYNNGYTAGKEDGYNEGYTAGQTAGYNTGYTEGANSVDITQDNQQAIEDYITENNYHTDSDYQQYGQNQYNTGYANGESAGFTNGANANIEEAYNNGYNYGYNQGYTSGMSDADNRVNTNSQSYIVGFTAGVGSVDITADNGDAIVNYITSNNYHTDTDYLNYGKAQYTSGYNEGQYTMINGIINNANEKYTANITNVCSEDKSKCNTFIESTNTSIYDKGYNDRDITTDNYSVIQTYLSENTLYTQKQYDDHGYEQYNLGTQTAEGYEEGYNDGYNVGQTAAEVSILDFFPGIIGAIIGFFITLMQISIFGVKIFDIVGILFGIGLIVLILKVMNGGGD